MTQKLATYPAREVAAVFDDVATLEKAVEKLLQAGFSDNDFNIMTTDQAVREKLSERYEAVEKLADDPRVPREAFVPRPARMAAEAAVLSLPVYLLGMGGALGVLATGGAAALALAAAAAGGTLGLGLGATLAAVLEKSHAERLASALEAGGIILWVRTPDEDRAEKARRLLTEAGGRDVHVHVIERTWGTEDIPLAEFNPDPFLGSDAPAAASKA